MRSGFVSHRLPLLGLALLGVACAKTPSPSSRTPGFPPPSQRPVMPRPGTFSDPEIERIAAVQPLVHQAARRHDLEPALINAVIWVESRFVTHAKSPAGARGLMQLMPATASALADRMGRHRPRSMDPEFNIAAGSLYLARLRDRYDGDLRLALAAYNGGAGNVDKWLAKNHVPDQVVRYVEAVLAARGRFEELRPAPVVPRTQMAARQVDEASTVRAVPEPTPTVRQTPAPTSTPRNRATRPRSPTQPTTSSPRAQRPEPAGVRYDLDRVESTYEPTVAPEIPLADTPYPPPPRERRKPQSKPRERDRDPTDDEPARNEPAPSPDVGIGILPSVLD